MDFIRTLVKWFFSMVKLLTNEALQYTIATSWKYLYKTRAKCTTRKEKLTIENDDRNVINTNINNYNRIFFVFL